jgi:GTP-binding protein
MVDTSDGAEADPAESYRVIHRELAGYSADLAARPTLLVATKVEDQAGLDRARAFQEAVGQRVYPISAATNRGLERLIDAISPLLRAPSD